MKTPGFFHRGQHHHGADHGRHACRVGNGLGADLLIALLMVADVVNIDSFLFSVLDAVKDTADVGLPTVLGPRDAGSGSSAFKNWIGTISCPLKVTGLVDSIPTFSKHFIWVR